MLSSCAAMNPCPSVTPSLQLMPNATNPSQSPRYVFENLSTGTLNLGITDHGAIETTKQIRAKCAGITLITPIFQTIFAVINVAIRIVKFIFCVELWYTADKERTIGDRVISWIGDLVRVLATPLAFIAFQLGALYGILFPLQGRAILSETNTLYYGDLFLKHKMTFHPCFMPLKRREEDTTYHNHNITNQDEIIAVMNHIRSAKTEDKAALCELFANATSFQDWETKAANYLNP